jgi:hypothetical protein
MKTLRFHKPLVLGMLAFVMVQAACASSSSPSSPGSSSSGDSGSGSGDQISVTGALTKTFAPVNMSIGAFGPSQIRLYMNEDTPSDLSRMGDLLTIDFPAGNAMGTYIFNNSITDTSVDTYATYGSTDGGVYNFKSVGGTITLTVTGSTYSGQFLISMVDTMDSSKTITVSGTFTDLPFNQ